MSNVSNEKKVTMENLKVTMEKKPDVLTSSV